MNSLKTITLEGYKSFRDAEVQFGDVTVLLGANGAGKSNLVSFFQMLNFLSTGALQDYVGRSGGSDSLLHYGRQATPQMRADIEFEGDGSTTTYKIALSDAAPDTLIFTHEYVVFKREDREQPQEIQIDADYKESGLKKSAEAGNETCKVLFGMLSRCRVYQFHDTSSTAKIRKSGYIEDAAYLRSDAGNLAAFLRAMQKAHPDCYQRIVDTVRLAFPSFADFVLEPSPSNEKYILLNWREQGHSDYLLGPHQLSDGTLRFMALATLFLQPTEKMASVFILDEPELGLHPYAITVFAGLVKSVAVNRQVILATQSTRLVDEFELDQVVVLELDGESGTRCDRLDREKLSEWLEEYSLSELWEKNIFGGRP
ncbi:MAG: AAA family ATPase [Candidatus Eisenbacteria sp.]|nr:AAA family ATPase [Candidatus Eisenbacteria bacterium]